jgi:hypothetical protein
MVIEAGLLIARFLLQHEHYVAEHEGIGSEISRRGPGPASRKGDRTDRAGPCPGLEPGRILHGLQEKKKAPTESSDPQ